MKTNIHKFKSYLFATLLLVVASFGTPNAFAQCVVASTNGYNVNLTVTPVDVIPNTTNCNFGYNFNYELNYTITFSGTNIPSSLYTLQGNVLASGFTKNFFDLPNAGGMGTTVSGGNSYTNKKNCNTVTVASLNPSVEIQIQGPGISYRTISCPILALPVELTSFSGNIVEQGTLLNWATTTEKNNDYFTIERSNDAATWEALDHVKGAGNSNVLINYSYTDLQPLSGINYYRIKQTDLNGIWSYSKIIAVDYSRQAIETSVYPNPAAGSTVTLRIATPSQEMLEAEIFNTMGQKLNSYSIPAGSGLVNYSLELPESGNMFIVKIIQNNTVIAKHQVLVK